MRFCDFLFVLFLGYFCFLDVYSYQFGFVQNVQNNPDPVSSPRRDVERKMLRSSKNDLEKPHLHSGPAAIAKSAPEPQWIAHSRSQWDSEFQNGQWRYMDAVPLERTRLAAIGGLTRLYGLPSNGTILDVGCGEGIMTEYITEEQKKHYIGVDISKVAIDQAIQRRGSPMTWIASVAHEYTPPRKVDVIVFSEMLYYVEFKKVLAQYESYLAPNGIIIISLWCPDKEEGMFSEIRAFTRSHFDLLENFQLIGTTGTPAPRTVRMRIDVMKRKKT
jgi:SAM-dependent methyltransferase